MCYSKRIIPPFFPNKRIKHVKSAKYLACQQAAPRKSPCTRGATFTAGRHARRGPGADGREPPGQTETETETETETPPAAKCRRTQASPTCQRARARRDPLPRPHPTPPRAHGTAPHAAPAREPRRARAPSLPSLLVQITPPSHSLLQFRPT